MTTKTPAVIDPETPETALAIPETQAVEAYTDYQWESDGTGDIAPSFPVIKIVQPTSSMEGAGKRGGEFWRSDTEEFHGTLDLVALFKKDTRAMFVEGQDQPVCASNDGIIPRDNMPQWEGQDAPPACGVCPFSQWGEDGTPPPCKASLSVLALHDGDLAQLRISGKSIKPFKQFVARKLAPKKLPLCSQSLHLYTEEKSEPGRKWYELRIDATPLPPAEAVKFNAVLRYERQRFEAAVAVEDDDDARHAAPAWGDGSASYAGGNDLPYE